MTYSTIFEIDDLDASCIDSYKMFFERKLDLGDSKPMSGAINYGYEGGYSSLIVEYVGDEKWALRYTDYGVKPIDGYWSYNESQNLSNFFVTDSEVLIPRCSFIKLESVIKLITDFLDQPRLLKNKEKWISNASIQWSIDEWQ